jgi:hypothetical protein
MALANPTHKGAGTGTTSAAVTTTPTANATLVATVFARQNTSVPVLPTIADTSGLTWNLVKDQQYDPGANPRSRGAMYQAVVGGSPVSITITGTVSGAVNTFLIVDEYTGAGTDFTNTNGNTNAAGDPSVTLPNALAATSSFHAHSWMGANNTINAVTGFTELLDAQAGATTNRLYSSYDRTSAPQTLTLSSTNPSAILIGVEVKEAGGSNNIAGTSTVAFSGAGAITGKGAVSGSASVSFASSGALAGTGGIAGSCALALDDSGTLAGSGDIAGSADIAFSLEGTLEDADNNNIAGSASLAFTLTGTLEPPAPDVGEDTWDALPPQPHRNTRKEREERRAAIKEVVRPRGITPSEPQKPAIPEAIEPVNQESGFTPNPFEAQIIDLQAAIATLKETRRNAARRAELQAQLEIARQAMYDEEAAIMLLLSA